MWKWEAEGTPKAVVAIIHSAYEYHYWYMWLIDQLRAQGYEVVMGDLPGHGDSRRRERVHNERFTQYETFVQQTIQVAAKEQLPVFVIGQGLGATLVIQALRNQHVEVAGVALLSPWLQLHNTPSKLSGALATMSKIAGNMKLTHGISLRDVTTQPQLFEDFENESIYSTKITVSWYRELQLLMKDVQAPSTTQLPNKPMLLMTGALDRITDTAVPRRWLMQQSLSEFQYKEWPNSSHNLHMSVEREEVLHYILDFFANVLRALGYIVE
ncbi:MAG: alpha/beta hydrolase [Caryophanon sp.]|nr:alpha/beta hydrolase [Caryophanon sp.]